jgi:DNA-binding NarL/FixJ family response regulator
VNPSLRTKVLLLVGNRLLCEALNRILRQRPDILVINQTLELSNLPVLISKSESDVILLDSASASVLHRQRVTRIRDLSPNLQVLMIGMDVDESAFLTAVRAGVSGYLLNDASAADVIAAIRAVSRGEAVCPPQLCKVLFDSVARSREHIVREINRTVAQLGMCPKSDVPFAG